MSWMILKLPSCHVMSVLYDGKVRNALPETNIAPENINRPLEKEIPIGNPQFLGATLGFSGGECTVIVRRINNRPSSLRGFFDAKPNFNTHKKYSDSLTESLSICFFTLYDFVSTRSPPPQKKSVDPIDLIPPPEKLNFALVVITTRTYQPPAKRQAKEMQSLSVLCAQPLGLENAGDMSAGDLRSWETQGWWVIAWSDGC